MRELAGRVSRVKFLAISFDARRMRDGVEGRDRVDAWELLEETLPFRPGDLPLKLSFLRKEDPEEVGLAGGRGGKTGFLRGGIVDCCGDGGFAAATVREGRACDVVETKLRTLSADPGRA